MHAVAKMQLVALFDEAAGIRLDTVQVQGPIPADLVLDELTANEHARFIRIAQLSCQVVGRTPESQPVVAAEYYAISRLVPS